MRIALQVAGLLLLALVATFIVVAVNSPKWFDARVAPTTRAA